MTKKTQKKSKPNKKKSTKDKIDELETQWVSYTLDLGKTELQYDLIIAQRQQLKAAIKNVAAEIAELNAEPS